MTEIFLVLIFIALCVIDHHICKILKEIQNKNLDVLSGNIPEQRKKQDHVPFHELAGNKK